MLEYIPLALSNLKAAKDIITTIQDLRDFEKITTATTELKERLIATIDNVLASKDQLLTFDKRITELEQENNRLKDWSLEKEKYGLKTIAQGIFAYMYKDFIGLPQNEYKLCCGCFEKNMKSPLQEANEGNGRMQLICLNGCPPIPFQYYISVK